MKFEYLDVEQGGKSWMEVRKGKVTASRLGDWMATSKRDGSPLKARLDYERELVFERQFGVNYNFFVTDAMQDGVQFEDFVADTYQELKKVEVLRCGCWYNDLFVASPDRIVGSDGLLEIKVLRDNSFTEVLANGVLPNHYLQIQGQLWATGREWCDYCAFNLTTKKLKIIRVLPDKEVFAQLEQAVLEPVSVGGFSNDDLFDVTQESPEIDNSSSKEIAWQ